MFKPEIEYVVQCQMYRLERDQERADYMFDRFFDLDQRPAWVRANDAPKRRRK